MSNYRLSLHLDVTLIFYSNIILSTDEDSNKLTRTVHQNVQ